MRRHQLSNAFGFSRIAWLVLLGAVVSPHAAAADLLPGDRLPQTSISLPASNGRTISLDDYRGDTGTMVIFTDNSCPEAGGWEERIARLANQYHDRLVMTVLVNSNDPAQSPADDAASIREASSRMGLKVPYLVDEKALLARTLGATHSPEVFLFDGAGRLVYHGAVDDSANDPEAVTQEFLQDALEALAGGESVAVPITPLAGCAIKFAE